MTTNCELGAMPDHHAEACVECTLYAGGTAILRDTWAAEHARDARWTRAQSERRLASSPMRGRSRSPWLLSFIVVVVALVVALPVQQRRAPPPNATATAAPISTPEPAPEAAPETVVSAAVEAVTVREIGASAIASEKAPPRLVLAWIVTLDATAIATAHDQDAPPWIDLRQGGARADAHSPGEIRTAQAIAHAADAAWTMNARAGTTHVEVTRGAVTVTALQGLAQRAHLHAPAVADVGIDGRIVVPSAPAPRSPADERAAFGLAESQLAHGDRPRARALLTALVGATDLAIAGDAAFLLSRSTDHPAERAAILGHYLTRRPPSPYREQALVEQAHAFLDAGDLLTPRAIAADLHANPALPAVVRRSLARLDARLHR